MTPFPVHITFLRELKGLMRTLYVFISLAEDVIKSEIMILLETEQEEFCMATVNRPQLINTNKRVQI